MKKKTSAGSGGRKSSGTGAGARASAKARPAKGGAKASKAPAAKARPAKAPARKPARVSPASQARPAKSAVKKKAPSRKGAGRLVIEMQESPAQAPAPIAPPVRGKAPARPTGLSGEEFAVEAARMMHDDKCTDVVVLDVRGRSPMADFIVIGSGTSDRQMKSVLMHLEELGTKLKFPTRRVNQDERATWLLADFFDVVAHLFEPNTRAHYDLEMLWGDAPRLSWERPDQVNRDRAGLNVS
ncbi:MAG: ribosome silencing factor [Planctomycetota bacterium]|nr:ribosome silencing factor [Planctomycetota bacterium]